MNSVQLRCYHKLVLVSDLAQKTHSCTTHMYLCCCREEVGPAGAGGCWSGGLSERRGWIFSERIREYGVMGCEWLLRGSADVEEEVWRTAVGVF